MRKFSKLPEMDQTKGPRVASGLADAQALTALSAIAMRCGGCGAKVGASVLSRVINELSPLQRDDILIGLHEPDDAAVVKVPSGKVVVQTVDSFRAMIDDPYLFGRIAANHSLGDIFAMNAEPQSALAIATLPYGLEQKVEDDLYQMMSGALEVLADANTALVGGHTSEGAELSLGFAINGLADPQSVLRKGGLQAGDQLILTKAVGTGALFAADMRHKAMGRAITSALESMLQSNRLAAACLRLHGATACTDVTGFGLLGHLVEMLRASEMDAEVEFEAVPLLDGAESAVRAGITSSLQPQNIRLRRAIANPQQFSTLPRFALLFDPQTAGGLLAGVPAGNVQTCLQELKKMGYTSACSIGEIKAPGDKLEPITLLR